MAVEIPAAAAFVASAASNFAAVVTAVVLMAVVAADAMAILVVELTSGVLLRLSGLDIYLTTSGLVCAYTLNMLLNDEWLLRFGLFRGTKHEIFLHFLHLQFTEVSKSVSHNPLLLFSCMTWYGRT